MASPGLVRQAKKEFEEQIAKDRKQIMFEAERQRPAKEMFQTMKA